MHLRLFRWDDWGNESGHAAAIFSACLLPLIAIFGSIIDLDRQASHQESLQNAVDIVAVSTARYALETHADDGELSNIARDSLSEQIEAYPRLRLDRVDFQRDGQTISVNVDGAMRTGVMRMVGRDALRLESEASAEFGKPVAAEIALVLDTSYSMRGARLTAVQDAAADMVDTLIDANPDTLKVSVVPFATYVNVGTHNHGQPWLQIEADQSGETSNCAINPSWYERNCDRERYACERDGEQRICFRWNCRSAALKNAPKTCQATTWQAQWHGCVKSRRKPYNLQDTNYADQPIVGIVTRSADQCPTEIQPLTNDPDLLKRTISALKPDQETYIASGLIWGLRTLSNAAPFSQATPYADPLSRRGRKALVLMSDGANTRSPNAAGYHSESNRNVANKFTRKVCDEIKAQGIEIYTIAYELEDSKTKQLLQECASHLTYYFDASDAEALNRAFKTVSAYFSNVSLVHKGARGYE